MNLNATRICLFLWDQVAGEARFQTKLPGLWRLWAKAQHLSIRRYRVLSEEVRQWRHFRIQAMEQLRIEREGPIWKEDRKRVEHTQTSPVCAPEDENDSCFMFVENCQGFAGTNPVLCGSLSHFKFGLVSEILRIKLLALHMLNKLSALTYFLPLAFHLSSCLSFFLSSPPAFPLFLPSSPPPSFLSWFCFGLGFFETWFLSVPNLFFLSTMSSGFIRTATNNRTPELLLSCGCNVPLWTRASFPPSHTC